MDTTEGTAENVRHLKGVSKGTQTIEENCSNETKCSNLLENYPAFLRSCGIYKRENEIMEVKYRRNITFLEARKIVERYMKVNTSANVAQKASLTATNNKNNQLDKYGVLIEKLLQLGPNSQ